MVTRDELLHQRNSWWIILIIHLFGFFLFVFIGGLFLGEELRKETWSSALGITFVCPAGLTTAVLMVYRASRKIREIERVIFH
jgi:hypothetical protein